MKSNFQVQSKTASEYMMQSSQIKLYATILFSVYAQSEIKKALNKNQELIEWFEKTLKMLEDCRTLRSFLKCFYEYEAHFPDFSLLLSHLENNVDEARLQVDEGQLLEALKQEASEALSREITQHFLINQAKNAKIIRLKNEEKTEIEEKYQALMKEEKLSPAKNMEEEIAIASWQYMLHALPELLSDVIVVSERNNYVANPSESQVIEKLITELNDSRSVYSKLSLEIKAGVKTYLTHYKKSTDYLAYLKMKTDLIGKPKVSKFENNGCRILCVTGGHLSLKEVLTLPELIKLKDIDEVRILATGTLFLNESMKDTRFNGVNIAIAGEVIKVTTSVTINTSGRNATEHSSPTARDGRSFAFSSSASSGCHGENGKHGDPGQSAGHVHIQAAKIEGAEKLEFFANGGNGGKGQNGGAGDKGQDGVDGKDAPFYWDGWVHHATNQYHIKQGTQGTLGQAGGNGGNAGQGGQGGNKGSVIVRDAFSDYVKEKKIILNAVLGKDGASGEPGQGGEAGLDGRRGLDTGVAYTGGFCVQKDEYLRGWGITAYMKKGGWFTKDIWRLLSEMSESQVKNTMRNRTREKGKEGAKAYAKNVATQKAVINFSHLLQQSPELAAKLTCHNTVHHPLTQQKINTLFALSERNKVLENEICDIETQQLGLTKKLTKMEEITQNFMNNVTNQQISKRNEVTQLVDFAETGFQQKKSVMPLGFDFFSSKSDAPRRQQKKIEPSRLSEVIEHAMLNNKKSQKQQWQHAITAFCQRFEKNRQYMKRICFEADINIDAIYVSLKEIIEILIEERTLEPKDLMSSLYEISVWHAHYPNFIKEVLSTKKDIFESLLEEKLENLFKSNYRRIRFALSFMQLDPAQLDQLREINRTDPNLIDLLDDCYHENFYALYKKSIIAQKIKIDLNEKEQICVLLKKIFSKAKKPRLEIGYEKSIKILDAIGFELDKPKSDINFLIDQLNELTYLSIHQKGQKNGI